MAAPTVTGIWRGLYSYAFPCQPVSFVAILLETAGVISGTTCEPSVSGDHDGMLRAGVTGRLRGSTVSFVKTYDGTGGWDHAVDYDGTLSEDETEIEGRWTIAGAGSGTFLMIREPGRTEPVAHKAAASA